MGKSEYTEIHYLLGEKAQPQIKIDAEALLDLLLRAELMSPKWLKYCHYNDDRRCFEANDGYRHHDILANTYKFRYHDSKRTKRAA